MTPHRCAMSALPLVVVLFLAVFAAHAEDVADLGSGRVVLVPPNLGVRAVDAVEPGIEPVWQEILQHFASQERPVAAIERASGIALWNDVMAELQADGAEADVYEAYAQFARRVAERVDYEEIIFPALVTRAARVRGRTASWDGVRQRVDTPGMTQKQVLGIDVSRQGVSGKLAAASLHVAVLDATGAVHHKGAGGLALLQEPTRKGASESTEIAARPRDDAFGDDEALRNGVEVAFRTPLPASRAR